jgi:tetratricopeptide (TPR) repeat protein
MTRLIAFVLLLLVCSSAALAQRIEREPIERNLPDEELLQLLEELELPEIRAAYDRLNRDLIGKASRARLEALQRSLAELRTDEVSSGLLQAHAESIRKMQEEIRGVVAALLAEPTPARERLELLTLRAETNLTMLHGPEALLLIAAAGMPTEAQRGEIVLLAAEARKAAEEALVLLDEVLYELEDELTQSGDAVARQERRRLIEDWRGSRLPLLSALAGSAEALAKGDETLATEALASFALLDTGDLSTSARISLALAQLSAGRSGQAERRLRMLLDDGVLLSSADQSMMAIFGLAQSLAESRRAADGHKVLDDLTRTPLFDGEAPPLWQVLLADCRFRLDLTQARTFDSEAGRRSLLADAARHYARLIETAGDLGLTQESLEDLILRKLSACTDLEGIEVESLPALALLARAQANLQDPATLAQGLGILGVALQRDNLDYDLAGRVFEAARYLSTAKMSGETLDVALNLALALGAKQSDSERKQQVLVTGLVLVSEARSFGTPFDPDTYESLIKARIDATDDGQRLAGLFASLARHHLDCGRVAEAVEVLLRLDPWGHHGIFISGLLTRARHLQWQEARETPEERLAAQLLLEAVRSEKEVIGAWLRDEHMEKRFVARKGYAARTIRPEVEALAALGELEQALDVLGSISPDDYLDRSRSIWCLRKRAEVLSLLGRTSEAAAVVQELLATFTSDAGREVVAFMERMIDTEETRLSPATIRAEAASGVGSDLLPLARELVVWARDNDAAHLPAHKLRLARVLIFAGEAEESLALLDSLVSADETIATQARYLLTRADACFLLDQDAEAFQLYSTLIQGLSAQGERNDLFWAATLRRLLILERQGRLDQIRPRLQRLRELDDTLGGETFRSELQALQLRLVGEGG